MLDARKLGLNRFLVETPPVDARDVRLMEGKRLFALASACLAERNISIWAAMRSGRLETRVAGRLTGIESLILGSFLAAFSSLAGYLPRSASRDLAALSRWSLLLSILLRAEATFVRLSWTAIARVPGTPAL